MSCGSEGRGDSRICWLADTISKESDFLVDGKYTFEIGGKHKGFSQIEGIPDSYVVADDLTCTIGNKLPLWMMGFLY